jgi:hypothetical protein
MKKIFRNNRLIAMAFLTLYSTAAAASVQPDISFSDRQVELSFIGTIYHQSVFQLKVNSSPGDEFTLSLTDIYGYHVYRENIKAGMFSKKFLFDTDELSDETLQLEVYNRTTKQTVLYKIRLTTNTLYRADIIELK